MKQATVQDLAHRLASLDGLGYKAYKRAVGAYQAGGYTLSLDHAQGDPFADASRFRAVLAPPCAGLPEWALATPAARQATADFLNRALYGALDARSRELGSGNSGRLTMLRPAQEILDRACLRVGADGGVTALFRVGLPARGRRILGHVAASLVAEAVAAAIDDSLTATAHDLAALRRHVEAVEDARALRSALEAAGLVAFVADGSILPRRSGVDDRPLDRGAIPFQSPEALRVTLEAPHAGRLPGLGIPRGVTLIVGGGYHGKSTLLRAVERGIHDHIPGDGRERVVTTGDAVKVRAEDGRSVAGTDISNFIGALPDGTDTRRFRTANASGSTSQAAAIVEALEVGATALLLDEDTSATNFLIRDARMQRVVASDREPITPLVDRARQLYEEQGVSIVAVVGGSGDYFDVADTVIAMDRYIALDLTARAREAATALPSQRAREGGPWRPISARAPLPGSVDPSERARAVSIRVLARDRVRFGSTLVDLGGVEQIVSQGQTRALAYAAAWARDRILDGNTGIRAVVEAVAAAVAEAGPGVVHPHGIGELAAFRPHELAAFLNRLRSLETVAVEQPS